MVKFVIVFKSKIKIKITCNLFDLNSFVKMHKLFNYILKTNRNKIKTFTIKTFHFRIAQHDKNSYKYYLGGITENTTLQSRILNYLENKLKIESTIVSKNFSNEYKKISASELKKIDEELIARFSMMDINEKFYNIHALMKYIPQKILNTKYYWKVMQTSGNQLRNDELLLQYIYYLSVQKYNTKVQKILQGIIRNFDENFIQRLSVEDFCIICLSAFKTSTFILNERLLCRIDDFILRDNNVFKDEYICIIIIKCMRHNRYYNTDLIKHIANNLHMQVLNFSFCVNSHILALFGTASYYETKLMKVITDNCINELKQNNSLRCKDVGRFVWGISFLGYDNLDKKEFDNLITQHVMNNLKNYKKKSQILIDIVLSLWMLGIRSEKLINEITPEVIKSIEEMDRYRYNSRFNLLLTCIDIDKQNIINNNALYNVERFNKLPSKKNFRESISKIKTILTKLIPKTLNLRIIINYQIPNINIDGITIYKDSRKLLEIEALDKVVCLQNTLHTIPNGIMKLKIDLLKQKECPIIMLDCIHLKTMYELEKELQNKLHVYL